MKNITRKKSKPVEAINIILSIMLLAMVLTWILPCGDIVFSTGANGEYTAEYVRVDRSPVYPWHLPGLFVSSVSSSLTIIVLIVASEVMIIAATKCGTIGATIGGLSRRFKGNEKWLVIIFTLFFSILGIVIPPQCFIGFAGTFVYLMYTLGYDGILALAIVFLGSAQASVLSPVSTLVALCQEVVGLPIYSGFVGRLISYVLFTIVSLLYFLRYAKRVKDDPSKSFLYGYYTNPVMGDLENARPIKAIDYTVLLLIIGTFGVAVAGCTLWGWGVKDISAIILVCGLLIGVISRMTIKQIVRMIVEGLQETASTIVIIIIANTIGMILNTGNVVNTIIYYSASALGKLPGILIPAFLLLLCSALNFIIPSGSAKAVLLLPIISPIGQLVGMTAQSTVMAYNYGDGFSNYIMPHDPGNASFLEATKIDYSRWVKFMMPLFWIWTSMAIIILTILNHIGYGPF